ncbi:MAG TPA: hypothetical protein VLA34_14895 [Candidatus Krumholzibacterium sp.]|nr:hypothetical protein [Candidatus Krumholzibacterium sp.]
MWKEEVLGLSGHVVYRSCSNIYEITYPMGGWAESPVPGTGLLVFDNLDNAMDFVEGMVTGQSMVICEAEVEHQMDIPRCRIGSPGIYDFYDDHPREILKKWWGGIADSPPRHVGRAWPVGTEAWERVKILREIMVV